jgi:hypothetical protein
MLQAILFYSGDMSNLNNEHEGRNANDDGNTEKGQSPLKNELLQKKKCLPSIKPEALKIKQKEYQLLSLLHQPDYDQPTRPKPGGTLSW